MFNKGLDSSERQEGLLKILKNIEDKTDNQLDLIRDQDDRQLDLIGNFNTGTKSIGFEKRRLSRLNIDNRKSKDPKKKTKQFLILQHQTEDHIILVIIQV